MDCKSALQRLCSYLRRFHIQNRRIASGGQYGFLFRRVAAGSFHKVVIPAFRCAFSGSKPIVQAVKIRDIVQPVETNLNRLLRKPQYGTRDPYLQFISCCAVFRQGNFLPQAVLISADHGAAFVDHTIINEVIITLPSCSRIAVCVNKQKHPILIRIRAQGRRSLCIEIYISAVIRKTAFRNVVAARSINICNPAAGIRMVSFRRITGIIVEYRCNILPLRKAAVNGYGFCSADGIRPADAFKAADHRTHQIIVIIRTAIFGRLKVTAELSVILIDKAIFVNF